jgi:hypothetical protein
MPCRRGSRGRRTRTSSRSRCCGRPWRPRRRCRRCRCRPRRRRPLGVADEGEPVGLERRDAVLVVVPAAGPGDQHPVHLQADDAVGVADGGEVLDLHRAVRSRPAQARAGAGIIRRRRAAEHRQRSQPGDTKPCLELHVLPPSVAFPVGRMILAMTEAGWGEPGLEIRSAKPCATRGPSRPGIGTWARCATSACRSRDLSVANCCRSVARWCGNRRHLGAILAACPTSHRSAASSVGRAYS